LSKSRRTYYRDTEFLSKVGNRIRLLRQEKGLTQTELAFECNDIDYSQINRMELGKVNFSISFLTILAKALNVEPKDLVG
jgi:transcriptional regulator with XRE-family HTH domain